MSKVVFRVLVHHLSSMNFSLCLVLFKKSRLVSEWLISLIHRYALQVRFPLFKKKNLQRKYITFVIQVRFPFFFFFKPTKQVYNFCDANNVAA